MIGYNAPNHLKLKFIAYDSNNRRVNTYKLKNGTDYTIERESAYGRSTGIQLLNTGPDILCFRDIHDNRFSKN